MIADQIKTQIAKLTEEKRSLEINMHRLDAAIWAFNETLKMLEPKSTEIKPVVKRPLANEQEEPTQAAIAPE